MVSIGSRYGVAHVMGVSLSGFLAMASKHLINVHYLWGLAGLNAVWEYIRDEFFSIEDRRSFIGGHLAAKIPVIFALPLRLWLGGKWIYEGVVKIVDGWLNAGGDEYSLFNPNTANIYLPGVSFGDAASGATQAADATAAATPAAGEAAAEYGEPLIEALGIYTWFAESVLSAAPWLAFLLQVVVVLAEVAIGLALVGGLFTFLAALASIGLGVMFIASGWGNPELIWYIFAAIVMLGGAGRGFGLDHWVIPWLKTWWQGTGLAKRTKLFTGEPRP
jgi:NADH:ubiquinone reductase (H+-translocating)